MSLEQVRLAGADEGGVVAGQVAHQGDIGVAVGAGPAQDDAVVHADQVAADAVDPEEEAALGPGGLDPSQRPGWRGGTGGSDRPAGSGRRDFGGSGPSGALAAE